MVKEKRILSYFLGWLIVGFCIIFAGINNVLASEYSIKDLQIQGYDNTGTSLTAATTSCYEAEEKCEIQLTTVAGSYGGAIGIQSPIPILPNHSYAISLKIYVNTSAKIALSKKNRIALGSSLGSAEYSYETEQYGNSLTYSTVNNDILQFVISSYSENAESYLLIPFTTNTTTTGIFTIIAITIDDLGENNLTQEQIDTSLNNQTNDLINNQNQNTQDIIDSNKETQDVIKDQFNSCKKSDNLLNPKYNTGLIWSTGTETTIDQSAVSSNFIDTIKGKIYSSNYYMYVYFYDNNYNFLGNSEDLRTTAGEAYKKFTVPNNDDIKYFRVWYRQGIYQNPDMTTVDIMLNEGTVVKEYEPYGEEICSNKIDETNDKLDDITGAITDESSPNLGGLENSAGWLPAGPLDSVLNLPLSLFNALTTNLNKSCSSISIPLPYVNKNITLPCINTLYNQIGITSFLSWIGVIVSGLMLYSYLLKLYKWIEDRISLNETHNVDSWGGL